eukprot:Lithocolla_globosa_v1_NODE_5472_length_1234_cov_15.879559.p1 type:complete len:128 gc:universal NODE_5472_length_1234_cov_15.879559:233-616(+)
MTTRQCTRCKVHLPIDENFEKRRSGEYFKLCNQCRKKGREYDENKKCSHGRKKVVCPDCKKKELTELVQDSVNIIHKKINVNIVNVKVYQDVEIVYVNMNDQRVHAQIVSGKEYQGVVDPYVNMVNL